MYNSQLYTGNKTVILGLVFRDESIEEELNHWYDT
jgi:hypothetical protein